MQLFHKHLVKLFFLTFKSKAQEEIYTRLFKLQNVKLTCMSFISRPALLSFCILFKMMSLSNHPKGLFKNQHKIYNARTISILLPLAKDF